MASDRDFHHRERRELRAGAEGKGSDQDPKPFPFNTSLGRQFTELVAAYSDDPETARNGGSMPPYQRGMLQPQIENIVFKEKKGFITDPIRVPQGFVILRIDERFEAGQASFDEVKDQIQERLQEPLMEARMRPFLNKLRTEAFLEIKDGYVDSGAAPGKDTRWHDVAQIKPQTTTKEEVAAEHRRHKHLLFIPIPGTTAARGSKNAPIDTSTLGEGRTAAPPASPDASGPQGAPQPPKQ